MFVCCFFFAAELLPRQNFLDETLHDLCHGIKVFEGIFK